jgi:Cd2+/Zn2+-exporting ATPase
MTEKTLKLDIPIILPGVEDDQDGCLERLETALQDRRGILRAHLEHDQSPLQLCLHYDPALVTIEDVRRAAQRAGAGITNRYHHKVIPIEGMDCSDCALVLEHSLERMDGVLDVRVSYVGQSMHVEYDSHHTNRRALEKRIRQLGYRVPVAGARRWYEDNRELLFSLVSGLLVLAGWLGERFFGLPTGISLALYLLAYLAGGYDITRHALHALRERHFDTDLLMVLAALGAAFLGEFAEGALLLFLFSLGHALEERALDRARNAIRALADLAPKTALVRRGGGEIEVPVGQLQIGDIVVVRPGVRVPVDGEVLAGESAVDQSPITGESIPVDKTPGDHVFAGSVNGEGALEVRVTRLARDSTLARVMEMVERAQAQKSPTQQMTERFTRWFVPAVLVGDLLLIAIPPLFGVPFREAFLRAMTLLVAASPCALALGTPSAILAGVAQAARNGVLVKGGVHLENMGRLHAIAFDKTGTITVGKPHVTDIVSLTPFPCPAGRPLFPLPLGEGKGGWGGRGEGEILALAAAVESRSAHPLAQAVVRAAQKRGLEIPTVSEANSVTGRGIQALVEGKSVWVGNLNLFNEAGVAVPRPRQEQVQILEDQGKTTMLVSLDGKLIGLIAVADVIRPEAPTALAELKKLGIHETVMLTGDNPRVATHIAQQVGLTDFRADLMPEDKLNAIRALVEERGVVAMVGDGVNDAPALANATVGIAMGGAGTDVALETADVALMANDLSKLPFAIGLGRATRAIIQQNLFVSLGVITVLIVLAVTGLAGIGTAIVFHEGSTIVVVLNSLRLLGYRSA